MPGVNHLQCLKRRLPKTRAGLVKCRFRNTSGTVILPKMSHGKSKGSVDVWWTVILWFAVYSCRAGCAIYTGR